MRNPKYGYGIQINKKTKRIYLKVPDHPYRNSRGYVLLSRLMVEHLLGRYLESHERVHHEDENPFNNDPNNLQLFDSQTEHVIFHNITRTKNPGLLKLRDKKWLHNQYIKQFKSTTQLGKELACSYRTVTNWLHHHKIPCRRHTLTPMAYEVRLKGAAARRRTS